MINPWVNEVQNPLEALRNGAHLILSVSGGKDSDATTHHLLDMRQREGWTGRVVMIHADLGRAEWHQTPGYVQGLADRCGVELIITRWTHGDLIDRIWQRYYKDPSRPCWPSAQMRYCTSDLKRGPISRAIRQAFPGEGTIICAMGIRADESPARAKKPAVSVRKDCTAPTKGRFTYDWLPIHNWSEDDVWACIDRLGGGIHHEAYTLGNQRLSCSLCVLASLNDLLNGAEHNPDTYREYCRIEAVTGYSFRQGQWLSDLRPDLLSEDTLTAIRHHKERVQA